MNAQTSPAPKALSQLVFLKFSQIFIFIWNVIMHYLICYCNLLNRKRINNKVQLLNSCKEKRLIYSFTSLCHSGLTKMWGNSLSIITFLPLFSLPVFSGTSTIYRILVWLTAESSQTKVYSTWIWGTDATSSSIWTFPAAPRFVFQPSLSCSRQRSPPENRLHPAPALMLY